MENNIDFKNVILSVMTYGNYRMMRISGSTPVELEYFRDHETLERQYQDKVEPEALGKAIIDAATCEALGGLQ